MDKEAVEEFVDEAQSILEASPQMEEEPTKFRLILPFIELLGWNTRSTEVDPEYTVRMATGKTKVDFALLLGETPVVFIEAKPARSRLDSDSVEQLRSYMRQELDVDWGVVTNGKSFEVLAKGSDGRQEEISLIEFDLEELKERPDLLEILTKESIQTGKSDEIAAQLTQAGQAIVHLQKNKEHVASALNDVLIDEIGPAVPLDTEAQTTEFVDDLIAALEEQRKSIGTVQTPGKEDNIPAIDDTHDVSGDYIIQLQGGGSKATTFSDDTQAAVMRDTVNYLIEHHDLISKLEPLPYVPGRKKAIINDQPTYPDGAREMLTFEELTGGYYLDTHANKFSKKREMRRLTEKCGLEIDFSGGW